MAVAFDTANPLVAPTVDPGAGLGAPRGRSAALAAFGDALRSARRSRGWSLQDLAAAVGVHVSTLSRIECGRIAPSAQVRDQVTVLFGEHTQVLRELGGLVRPDWLPTIEPYLMVKYELTPAQAAHVSRVLAEVIQRADTG